MKKLVVSMSHRLARTPTRLSMVEQKFLKACIGQIYYKSKVTPETEYKLDLKNFAELFGISEIVAYREFKAIASGLVGKTIQFPNFDLPEELILTSWVTTVRFNDTEEYVIVKFCEHIIPHISELQANFISYNVEQIVNFQSPYALRLYELCKSYNHKYEKFKFEVEIAELQKLLGIAEPIELYGHFKRILTRAIKEIKQETGLDIKLIEHKDGRKVVRLTFQMGEVE